MADIWAYLSEHAGTLFEYGIFLLPFAIIAGWIVASAFGKGDAYQARIPRWLQPKGKSEGPLQHEDPSEGHRRSSPPPERYQGGGGDFGGGGASGDW